MFLTEWYKSFCFVHTEQQDGMWIRAAVRSNGKQTQNCVIEIHTGTGGA